MLVVWRDDGRASFWLVILCWKPEHRAERGYQDSPDLFSKGPSYNLWPCCPQDSIPPGPLNTALRLGLEIWICRWAQLYRINFICAVKRIRITQKVRWRLEGNIWATAGNAGELQRKELLSWSILGGSRGRRWRRSGHWTLFGAEQNIINDLCSDRRHGQNHILGNILRISEMVY